MRKIFSALIMCLVCLSLNGRTIQDTLTVGYATAPPFIIQNNDRLEGINIWLWKRVARDLNLPYKMVPMNFSPMLDSLTTGGIDISINPLTITGDRNKRMEFTHSFYASYATIAISEQSSFQKFIQFVKGFLNLNFLKGFLILISIITVFGFMGWYFERRENPEHFRGGVKGLWDGLWWSAVTLSTVGYGDKAPKSAFGKLAALILMFTGLLFISGLTAGVASSLTLNQLNSSPDGFNEFKERAVGTVKNAGTIQFLRSHFFKNINEYPNVTSGLIDVGNKEIEAFVYDEPILKYRIQQDSSLQNLTILPLKFDVQFYAFGVAKKKTQLERKISQRMLEIIETEEWQIVLHEYGLTDF